jgi:hypothetical protein
MLKDNKQDFVNMGDDLLWTIFYGPFIRKEPVTKTH